MNIIIAFTDGASKGNPGPGGWGTVLVDSDHIEELGGGEDKTTNNRMEMMAALKALEYAQSKRKDLVVYTDSSYLINGITQWVFGWKTKGWKTASGGQVLNQDIWKELVKLTTAVKTDWKHLPGHSGVPGNERADDIASGFGEKSEVPLYRGPIVDYPVNVMDFSVDPKMVEQKARTKKNTGKAFSYISMINSDIKTHKTWADTEARVKGVRGAKYRKALNPEQEKEIIESWRGKQ
jgi:ribonuclease HI